MNELTKKRPGNWNIQKRDENNMKKCSSLSAKLVDGDGLFHAQICNFQNFPFSNGKRGKPKNVHNIELYFIM
jgi:phosphopantetheinyl transferase